MCGVFSPRLLRNRRLRMPLLLLLFFYLGLAIESDLLPHYFAPATVLLFLIATAAVQDISSRFPRGKRRTLVPLRFFTASDYSSFPGSLILYPALRYDLARRFFIAERQGVLARLDKEPGKLLVFVRRSASLYSQRVGVQ